MRLYFFCLILVFLLVGCATEELPPTPPAPGGGSAVGRAYGGVPISATLPSWAVPIKYTDISPTSVKLDDTVVVTVQRPVDVTAAFLVYSEAYVLNKKFTPSFWEKAVADTYASGSITQKWARDKAVFNIPVSADRFVPGMNFIIVYFCVDAGYRDAQGAKVWDCNNRKWAIGAFDFVSVSWPDILIEKNVENNRYKSSAKTPAPSDAFTGVNKTAGVLGDAYTATYTDLQNVRSDVTVIKLNNVAEFKRDLSKESLDSKWGTIAGSTCGFLFPGVGSVSFSWLSGSYWVTVKTYGSALKEELVGNYAKFILPDKYPSNCNLLNETKTIAALPVGCGNSIKEAGEDCEKNVPCVNASLSCDLKTCKCVAPALQVPSPVCGNSIKESGEECEKNVSCVNASWLCNVQTCKCIAPACGDNVITAPEMCEKDEDCKDDEICEDCKCIVPECGDGNTTHDEECEWDDECRAGEVCSYGCQCVIPKCGDKDLTPDEECETNQDCDDLDLVGNICLANCSCAKPSCGDKIVTSPEQCDPPDGICKKGNVTGTCGADCNCNICGDYKINQPFEQCEPPKTLTCDENCTITGPAAAPTMYVCRRPRRVTEDHYLSTSYPCPEGFAQRIQGRLLPLTTIMKADMVKIVQCYYSRGNEHRIAFDYCPSETTFSSALGLAYKIEKPGTIPVVSCRFDAGDEYFTMTESCPKGSSYIQTFYALPFCEESDKSRNLLERGITKEFINNTEYVDTCEDGALREYYCDDLTLPSGVKEEKVACPAGYSCKEGACVQAAAVSLAETVPLFHCKRRTTWRHHGEHKNYDMDDYYSSIPSSSGAICEGGSQLAIQGRVFKEQQENTVPLMSCFWGDRQEFFPMPNDCAGNNVNSVVKLGYVYPSEQPGTIPLRHCMFTSHKSEDHFTTTGACPSGSSVETGITYILPPCEDIDGGRIPKVKGWIDAFDKNWKFTPKLFEDTCEGAGFVKEYYCNSEKLPFGHTVDAVPCPAGTRCDKGECVAVGSTGQALYLGEVQEELGSDIILVLLAVLGVITIAALAGWSYFKKK